MSSSPWLAVVRFGLVALALAIAAAGFSVASAEAKAGGSGFASAKKKAAKKKSCKKTQTLRNGKCVAKRKRCKKTQVLRKGKCVKKPVVKTEPKTPGKTPGGPDPASDADGDGLPYSWEAKAPVTPTKPSSPKTTKKCSKQKKLKGGKCVPRCKKGRMFKKGKCVKKKASKKGAKGKAKRVGASAVAVGSLHAYGANPNRKDIFVQVDFASAALRQSSTCGQFDAIYAAFANAPVSNPDGSTGITLHIDAGKVCPSRSYDLGGSTTFDAGACPTGPQILQALRPPESRVGAFHFSGFGPTCGTGGDGGVAQQPGTTSAVYTEGGGFAMPFMHELGHNLGLGHGPQPAPNRLSVMNARMQTSPTDSSPTEVVDYQRIALPALDENALSEPAGIGAPTQIHHFYIRHRCPDGTSTRDQWLGHDGAVDWNCNTPMPQVPPFTPTIDPGPLPPIDVNGDGQTTVLPATGNEWLQLNYAADGQIGKQ